MYVLGHEDKPGQLHCPFFAGRFDASCQFLPPHVVGQQRHPPIAREGQLVQMADLVKMPHHLPMCHAPLLPSRRWNVNVPQHWQSQWHTASARHLCQCHPPFVSRTRSVLRYLAMGTAEQPLGTSSHRFENRCYSHISGRHGARPLQVKVGVLTLRLLSRLLEILFQDQRHLVGRDVAVDLAVDHHDGRQPARAEAAGAFQGE